MIRTFFIIESKNHEPEFMCFHDQVSRIATHDGHAVIVTLDGAQLHLHAFTVAQVIEKLIAPAYAPPQRTGGVEDVGRPN